MALHLQTQSTPHGGYTEVDLTAEGFGRPVLKISDQHPASLSWVMHQAQHTFPIALRSFVRFWDDAGTTPDGSAQSASNPIFEGHVYEIEPTDSNLLSYTAYDPTMKSTREITVMNLPYTAGIINSASGGTPPAEASGSMPRLLYNCTIDNDDDFTFCEGFGMTVGEMIADILGFVYQPLYWANAAPGDGTDNGNGSPYESTDLLSTSASSVLSVVGMNFQPQEKIVFDSEGPRSAVDRLLTMAPMFRLLWRPGARKWRFHDVTASPTATLTLNTKDGSPQVLSMELHRSLEQRYTAVKFYGPEVATYTLAKTSDGSLTDVSTFVSLQNDIDTCCQVLGINKIQITTAANRFVCRLLPYAIDVQVGPYTIVATRSPTISAYWPETSAGDAGWRVITGWSLDANTGVISWGNNNIFRYNPNPAPGQPNYENPTDIKFEYARPTNPLSVRYPVSGYSGTAYDVAGLASELKIYDEMVAIGFEYFNPVTSATRLAQFSLLAQYQHALRKDIAYSGAVVLDGCQYAYCWLNKRVNIAGVDGSGGTVTTGWESLGMVLTDVEINFSERTTSLTFNGDQLELVGIDVAGMKERLGIRALRQVAWSYATFGTTIRQRRIGDKVSGFDQFNTIHETTTSVNSGFSYVDDTTGRLDSGRGMGSLPTGTILGSEGEAGAVGGVQGVGVGGGAGGGGEE